MPSAVTVRNNLILQHNNILLQLIAHLKEEFGTLSGQLLRLLECQTLTANNLSVRTLIVEFLVAHHINIRGFGEHNNRLAVDKLALSSIAALSNKDTRDNSEEIDPLSNDL